MHNLEAIKNQTTQIVEELIAAAGLEAGQILVVGCSSSEVGSHTIGTFSSADIGKAIFDALYEATAHRGIYLAAQCCEHLNRALIVDKACAREYSLPRVNARPQLKAGGSFATAAYETFPEPWVVEHIQAHAGIDIGDTLIGMHLTPVAVPYRPSTQSIGNAHVVCARTRTKYIGGERACYIEGI